MRPVLKGVGTWGALYVCLSEKGDWRVRYFDRGAKCILVSGETSVFDVYEEAHWG